MANHGSPEVIYMGLYDSLEGDIKKINLNIILCQVPCFGVKFS